MAMTENSYEDIVKYLETLQIMPKAMPGLEKIRKALLQTSWYSQINADRVIVVAGTNGKGTTCAALESLLVEAGCQVGFYSSPHLISTTERIRLNKKDISEKDFVTIFKACEELIIRCELSHFEALTLMACYYYFSGALHPTPDFVILEVGLGGAYDATNAIPHKYSVITSLSLDHTNILGHTLMEIAQNKFGIVGRKNIVVHYELKEELHDLKNHVRKQTNSNWIESEPTHWQVDTSDRGRPVYYLNYDNESWPTNMCGERAMRNIMTAITTFQALGFDMRAGGKGLSSIRWQGRMQSVQWPGLKAPLYLSGDHNEDGVKSLIHLLKDFKWKKLYLVVGIGADKDVVSMLEQLTALQNSVLCLTETTFKPRKLSDYPEKYKQMSRFSHSDVKRVLDFICNEAEEGDLCIVTGSLYLVGRVLQSLESLQKI